MFIGTGLYILLFDECKRFNSVDHASFRYPITYLLLFVLVFTAVIQIKYLNKALQRFDSTEVIPTQFVLFTISAITGSAVLYHDFENMDTQKMTRYVGVSYYDIG